MEQNKIYNVLETFLCFDSSADYINCYLPEKAREAYEVFAAENSYEMSDNIACPGGWHDLITIDRHGARWLTCVDSETNIFEDAIVEAVLLKIQNYDPDNESALTVSKVMYADVKITEKDVRLSKQTISEDKIKILGIS